MRIFALAVLTVLVAHTAHASPQPPTHNDCFLSSNWQGWNASKDGDALYIGVRPHDVYRVDFSQGSHVHWRSDRILINHVRGSNWICTALDLDLVITDHDGLFSQPLIARNLRKLSADEVAAIPAADQPH